MWTHGRVALLLLACLLVFAAPARAAEEPCTIAWATDQDGAWDVAGNWSPSRVPTTTDDVCLDRAAASPKVTISADAHVRSLHSAERVALTGGQLTLDQASDVTGAALDLSGGRLQLNATLTVSGTTTLGATETDGGGALANTGTLVVTGTRLGVSTTNAGTLRLDTSGMLTFARASTNTGVIELNGDGGLTGALTQSGTLRKTAGAGTSVIGSALPDACCFRLDGTSPAFDARTGTLQLGAPATWSGGASFATASGARVRITRNLEFSGTLTGSGAGAVELAGIDVFNSSSTLPANLSFPADMLRVANTTLRGGNGDLINLGQLSLTGPSTLGHRFVNAGVLRQAADTIYGGTVTNRGGWDLDGDVRLTQSGNGRFQNDGTLRKSSGAGTATVNGDFFATAQSLTVDSGVLNFAAPGTWSEGARLTVAAGATLRLHRENDCCWTLAVGGTITGSGAGTVTFDDGRLTTTPAGAQLDFPAGMLQLRGGQIDGGAADVVNAGALTIAAPIAVSHRFVNTGTVTQSASSVFNGLVTNRGLWALDGDVSLTQNANGSFQNDGTVRKTSGTGTGTLDGAFNGTHPTFDAQTGTLLLKDQSTWTGGAHITAATGATFRLRRNDECCWTITASGTITGSGGGRFELVNGRLTGPTLDLPAGFLHVLGGQLDHVTNTGELTLEGSQLSDGFTNSDTVIQTGDVAFNGNVTNTGTWDIRADRNVTQNANGRFQNDGTIRKSAGTGTAALDGNFNSTHPTFDVQAGVLNLKDQSTWTGGAHITAATGATFRLRRNDDCCWTITASGTITGSGGGRFEMLNGDLRAGADPLKLDFPAGYFHARGGTLHALENLGTIELTDAHIGDRFVNTGTVNHTGATSGGYDGNVTNAGVWNLGGEAGLTATANNNFANTGTVRRTGGTLIATITGNFNNLGTVEARAGVLAVQSATQLQGSNRLTGGTWLVSGTGTLTFPTMFGIQNNAGTIGLSGPDAHIPELEGASGSLHRNTGSLTLEKGAALHLPGDFANAGTLALGRSTRLSVAGAYTQEQAGTLAVTIDGRPASGAYGALEADGAAALNGTLAIATGSAFTAVTEDRYPVLRAGSRSGSFATISGLPISPGVAFAPDTSERGVTLRVAAAGTTRAALRAANVTATPAAPGDDVTVNYTVVNDGDPTTAGAWTDSIYLSEDGAYDPSDALIGRAPHTGNLARDGSYTGTLTAPLPGVTPGEYRILVVPDSRGANPSPTPGGGAAASAPRTIDIPVLGAPVSGSVPAGRDRYYRIPGGAGDLQIDGALGAAGRARVLVRTGAIPDSDSYEQASDGDAAPRIFVPNPGTSTVYVAVHGLAGGAFTLQAGPVAFAVAGVSPGRASATGSSTLTVTGAGFTSAATATLVGAGTVPAARVVVADGRLLHATFALAGVEPGSYGVRITDGARSATLPNAFTVTASADAGHLELSTDAPPRFRIGYGGFFTVVYRNTGGSDVPMPLVRVTSNKASARVLGAGSASFFARPPGAPADVVPPGASIRVQVQFSDSGVAPHEIVHFKTELIAPDETPIDWASRKAGLKPAGLSAAAWEKIWPTFLGLVGSTNASYLAALRAAAERAAARGRDLPTEADLLLALRERAIARAPGAPVHGTLSIAGAPAVAKILTLFDPDGDGGAARTDDGGAFSIWDVPAGTYTLSLRGREQDPWGTVVAPQASALAVALPGAAQIAGVVQDTKGAPIPGAHVQGRDARTRRLYLAETDKRGHFLLDDVLPGTVRVSVTPAHAAPPAAQEVVLTGSAATTPLTFTVGSGAAIQGTVTRTDGSVAAGAIVTAGSQQTETDAAGNYIVDSLAAGTYLVTARAAGTGSVSRAITVAANASATGDLRLDPEGRITGTVTAGGEPLAGATIVLSDAGAHQDPLVSNAGGTFALGGLSAGEHRVTVSAAGYATRTQTVNLAPGAVQAVTFALARTGAIHGRAVAGATVYARSAATPLASTTADGDGDFAFADLPPGHYAVALDGGLSVARRDVDVAGGDDAEVNLAASTVALSGTTRTAGGSAAGRIPVMLVRSGDVVDRAVSDAAGHFAFRVADPGPYTVVAAGSGYGLGTSDVQTVGSSPVSAADVRSGSAALLVRAPSATEIAVTPDGGGPVLRATAGADGTARLSGLPAGAYRVSAVGGGQVVRSQLVNAPGTVDAALAPAVAFGGRVTDAAGKPVAGANVLATDPATGATAPAVTGPDGRYAIPHLPAGAYSVAVADGVHRALVRSATAPGTLDFTLSVPPVPLVVTAQDAAGTTLGGVRALLELREDADHYVAVAIASSTDALRGAIRLGGLEAGKTYRLTLAAPGRPATRTTFTAEAPPARVTLPALAALHATPPAAKTRRAVAAALPVPGLEDIKDTIFHAFDVAGNQLKPPTRIDFDTDPWRYQWVNYANNSCDPELAADLAAARDAALAIQKAFSDWQIDFEKARDERSEDFLNLTTAATNMAAQVTLLLTSIAGFEAVVAAEATLTAAQSALLGAAGNLAQSLSTAINDLRTGQGLVGGWSSWVDHVTGLLGALMGGEGANPAMAGDASYGAAFNGWGTALAFLDTIKAAYYDISALRNAVDDNVAKTMAEYLDDQQKYLDAVERYKAALDRLRFYQAADDKCPDPPPPAPPVIPTKPLGEPNIEGISADDPNDIVGPAGRGAAHFLPEGSTLDYTIHYENKATASLPARKVIVTHVLDPDADLSTFALGSAGFDDHIVTAPARRQSWRATIDDTAASGTVVEVDARLNAATRTATWTFTALDERTGDEPADPLRGFLAPARGGFATYSVRPLPTAPSGTRVDAQARIVFDANPPIDTAVYANTLDLGAPVSTVEALPAMTTATSFPVRWSGTDDASGIAAYDVYVSTDGGAFVPLATGTTDTAATFAGAVGHRYAFYSVATDAVDHIQATPAGAQAQTEVVAAQTEPGPITIAPPPPVIVTPPAPVAYKPQLLAIRKSTGTYELRLRNAGAKADRFKLRGTGTRPGFSVRYLAGRKDVTKQVVKGTYRTATIAPGRTVTLKLVVKLRGKKKRKASWTVTATSAGSPTTRSTATARYPR